MDVCAGLLQGERCVPSPLQVLFPEKEGVREMSFKKNKKKKKNHARERIPGITGALG